MLNPTEKLGNWQQQRWSLTPLISPVGHVFGLLIGYTPDVSAPKSAPEKSEERMSMPRRDCIPPECRGVDLDKAVLRMPAKMGALFLAAGEQRLRELDQAMDAGNAEAVMDAAHSLASLTGLVPVQALASYAREIYAAGEQGDLPAADHAHKRLGVVMGWIFSRLRSLGHEADAS